MKDNVAFEIKEIEYVVNSFQNCIFRDERQLDKLKDK